MPQRLIWWVSFCFLPCLRPSLSADAIMAWENARGPLAQGPGGRRYPNQHSSLINAVSLVVGTARNFSGCATCIYGLSHWPESAERKIASITAILLIPSETETGTSPPSRMDREKASPWIVYWSQ